MRLVKQDDTVNRTNENDVKNEVQLKSTKRFKGISFIAAQTNTTLVSINMDAEIPTSMSFYSYPSTCDIIYFVLSVHLTIFPLNIIITLGPTIKISERNIYVVMKAVLTWTSHVIVPANYVLFSNTI